MPQTATRTAPTTARRGFGALPCPKCGEDSAISLDLDDLTTCRCRGCEEHFGLVLVRAIIERWAPVLAWIDLASPAEGE